MNAFTRMFHEPHAKPPKLSMARVAAIPLFVFGVLWLGVWTVADWLGRSLTMPWWAGLALICTAGVLYAVNKFNAGPVSVEFSGTVQNVDMTETTKGPDK